MTVGQHEDDKAFRVALEAFAQEYVARGMAPRYLSHERRAWMRFAFDAGMKRAEEKRGEEKRGCCEKRDG